MEIAVQPLRLGRPTVADGYAEVLYGFPNLTILEVTRAIAWRAAALRAQYRLHPADSLHVATALERGATTFVTNDRDLARVRELRVLILADFPTGGQPAPA